jgi:hypothetical protein
MQSYTAIGQVIDADLEELKEYLAELNYGQLTNVKKMLEIEYQRVNAVKEGIIVQVQTKLLPNDEKSKKTLSDLYAVLQRIENRATVIATMLQERSVKLN